MPEDYPKQPPIDPFNPESSLPEHIPELPEGTYLPDEDPATRQGPYFNRSSHAPLSDKEHLAAAEQALEQIKEVCGDAEHNPEIMDNLYADLQHEVDIYRRKVALSRPDPEASPKPPDPQISS